MGQYPNSLPKDRAHNKDASELSGGKQDDMKDKSPEST